jgi:hypothetical protein
MEFNYENIKPGDVFVRNDGTKRPPERFNKKLAAWKDRNYTGTVSEVEAPSKWAPFGRVCFTRPDYPANSVIVEFKFNAPIEPKFMALVA